MAKYGQRHKWAALIKAFHAAAYKVRGAECSVSHKLALMHSNAWKQLLHILLSLTTVAHLLSFSSAACCISC